MYFRNRDYNDDSLFKTRLKKLVDEAGIQSARKLAEILFDKKLVDYKPKKEDDEEWKFKQDRIGAIAKKVQAHLNADTPKKVTGEYIEAYCKLFHCSPDYLFGRTVIRSDEIEVRRFCEVSGLSEAAVMRLVNSERSEVPIQSGFWSGILCSDLFYSIPKDYLTLQGQLITEVRKTVKYAGKKWEKENFPNDVDSGINYQIEELKEEIDSSRAAFYGMIAKMSRDMANYFETQVRIGFEEYKEGSIEQWIKNLERFYTEQSMLHSDFDTSNEPIDE